jgi:nitroimidazol reductase NimA-like FMN-containing flavoprotein (pyridoxamine 5'-phosphate oxidase superfamily)
MKNITDYNSTPSNVQRKPERSRDDAWIRTFLRDAQTGHLATSWDEQPFITPLLFWYDESKNAIYFHHAQAIGRLRMNLEHNQRVCFETFRAGRLLPSNVALEFSVQYASVIVYGVARLVEGEDEKRRALMGMLLKYFPDMSPAEDYRPITEKELAATNVYAIDIKIWAGKENWPAQAAQSNAWPPLSERWLKE